LVGRAFFDTPDGPEEYAYLPDDLLPLLPAFRAESGELPGHPASPTERASSIQASDLILEDACTFLTGLRLALP
jgi:hypothetical protein